MDAIETTDDAILNGRVRLRQPARGYRVNVDTLLLAAAVEAPAASRLAEAGCGVGAALLNGTLAHSLDFDDTHAPGSLHPSAPVVPAALAAAEMTGAPGRKT